MAFYSLLFLFFFFFFIHFSWASTEAAAPTYLRRECATNKTFIGGIGYRMNLDDLFSFLSKNATGKTVFYNTTVSTNPSDTAFGLFMCTGVTLTPQICHQCVRDATARLSMDYCSYSKEAVIWYEQCLVRYSNRSFFFTVDTWPKYTKPNSANVFDLVGFDRSTFNMVINATADEAAVRENKYAQKEFNIPRYPNQLCVAQCTPDLSPQDCRRCLSEATGNLQKDGRLELVIYPSCYFRSQFLLSAQTPTVAPSPSDTSESDTRGVRKGHSQRTIVVVVVSIVFAAIMICFCSCIFRSQMRKSYKATLRKTYFGSESTTLESLQFSLATIEAATNKFSRENKIGKGGFGEVYKGILLDGREIAVKRLSTNSRQGATEFKNEILLIAKLQHRNLVALLGFCLEAQENILIYEYVPNNSLDYFLFGSQRRRILNWLERYNIIKGIARGILYLHEYSRLKVIHRDLKPSNILLDNNMIPKISDFGMAKIVAIEETEGSTNRIVGTIGYMSPEYAMLGQFSEKLDVFSFGVIVLEIVSGKKNASGKKSQYVDGLLSYAWKQWKKEKSLQILDSNMTEFNSYSEVIKCIHIGLLCVQENPNVRPSMITVVQYLENDSIQLPLPQQPAFFMHDHMEPPTEATKSTFSPGANSSTSCSINEMSLSKFLPR